MGSHSERSPIKLAIMALVIGISGVCMLAYASQLVFLRSTVINTSDSESFGRESLAGFVLQSPSNNELKTFRNLLPKTITMAKPSLEQAIALCHWVRIQQPGGESWRPIESTLAERLKGDSEDPLTLLRVQRSGFPANCRRFAYLFASAASSVGMRSRVIVVSESLYKVHGPSHVMAEVWIPQLNKWVLMDAMWDEFYLIGDRPASAIEVYNAVNQRNFEGVSVTRFGGITSIPNNEILRREFTHLFISLSNAYFDGYQVCFRCEKEIQFAHLTSARSGGYPNWSKLPASFGGISAILLSVITLFRSVLALRPLLLKHSPATVPNEFAAAQA